VQGKKDGSNMIGKTRKGGCAREEEIRGRYFPTRTVLEDREYNGKE